LPDVDLIGCRQPAVFHPNDAICPDDTIWGDETSVAMGDHQGGCAALITETTQKLQNPERRLLPVRHRRGAANVETESHV